MITARDYARFYYSLGWNPLPSRQDRKAPALLAYRAFRDGGHRIPEFWLDQMPWHNIQLCLGIRWGLLVVDVDGLPADLTWADWDRRGRTAPDTWTVRTRGGFHFYFRIPRGVAACPTRKVWLPPAGSEGHCEIQILGDRALAVAPPSHHVDDRAFAYQFLPGLDPQTIPLPAFAPRWLLNLRAVGGERRRPKKYVKRPRERKFFVRGTPGTYRSLAEIPDSEKLALAVSWGLRVARQGPNGRGWLACHALDREDRNPSASFHLPTGMFWQSGRKTMCLASLAVALGAYPDLPSAFRGLGVEGKERAACDPSRNSRTWPRGSSSAGHSPGTSGSTTRADTT